MSTTSYYIQQGGRKYKRALLELVEAAVAGQGDGRISKENAEAIFQFIADADKYTDTEKATLRYIRQNYKFTEAADKLLRSLVASWAAKRGWKTRRAKMEADQ